MEESLGQTSICEDLTWDRGLCAKERMFQRLLAAETPSLGQWLQLGDSKEPALELPVPSAEVSAAISHSSPFSLPILLPYFLQLPFPRAPWYTFCMQIAALNSAFRWTWPTTEDAVPTRASEHFINTRWRDCLRRDRFPFWGKLLEAASKSGRA